MHFASTIVAAAALAVFGAAPAAAVAMPAELEPRLPEGDDTLEPRDDNVLWLKYYSHTSCSGRGGPNRGFPMNKCISLDTDSHGLKLTGKNPGCWVVRFSDGNCNWNNGWLGADTIGTCYDVGDSWNSIMIRCG